MVDLSQVSGDGFFGSGYWGRKIFWYSLPDKWRELDGQNGGYLQKLTQAYGDFSESFVDQVRELTLQRQPYDVRTESTKQEWFYVTESLRWEDDDRGEVIRLIGEANFDSMPATDEDNPPVDNEADLERLYPWFPYSPIVDIGRWWRTRIDNSVYEVVNVRTRNYDTSELYDETRSLANEAWISGGDLELQFDYSKEWTDIATGDGSQVVNAAVLDDPVRLDHGEIQDPHLVENAKTTVRIIVSDTPGGATTEVLLYDKYTGDDTANLYPEGVGGELDEAVSYGTVDYLSGTIQVDLSDAGKFFAKEESVSAKWVLAGRFLRFFAPPMIDYLAEDYGFENDRNDPEDVQRSTIANLTKFLGKKATEDSYRIRGAISLFDVLPVSLYRVCEESIFDSFDDDVKYEIDGKMYVGVDPAFVRFDDIRADELLFDFNGGLPPSWITLVDNPLIASSSTRWDGMTIGQAYAVDVCQGMYAPVSETVSSARGAATVSSVSELTEEQLETFNISGGYAISIEMKRCQAEAFNFFVGKFALSEYEYGLVAPSPDDPYALIDGEVSEWTVDTPGATSGEDVGTWTVAIGVATGSDSPFEVGADIAVRYLPGVGGDGCCVCRTKCMVMEIEATDEAYEYYTTDEKVENSVDRLKDKLGWLTPVHAIIKAWDVTRRTQYTMYGVQNGAEVEHVIPAGYFQDSISMFLTVEYRGDLSTSAKGMHLYVNEDPDGLVSTLWNSPNASSGYSDPDTWRTHISDYELNMSDTGYALGLYAIASASSEYADVRWTIRYRKRES